MAKYFKEGSYDPTKTRQAPGYDAKAQYRHNKNTPTSHAIRQLGEEWMFRKPPKGIFKELKIPANQGSHTKTASFKDIWNKGVQGWNESRAEQDARFARQWDKVKAQGQYGKYLGKHKYYVYKSGKEFGVPSGTLLRHDLSKMRPSEWFPYSAFWYGPEGVRGSDPDRTKETRYGKATPKAYARFMRARNLHFNRNPHHFHKIDQAQQQDFNTKLEMVADWYSTNRTIHEETSDKPFPTFRDWYKERRQGLKVDPEVIVYIDNYLANRKSL